jgi:hypothetical protein
MEYRRMGKVFVRIIQAFLDLCNLSMSILSRISCHRQSLDPIAYSLLAYKSCHCWMNVTCEPVWKRLKYGIQPWCVLHEVAGRGSKERSVAI